MYMVCLIFKFNYLIVKIVNEFDEILDLSVRKKELIEEEVYEMLKGKFFKVIISQNGSRVLQKALKNTESAIIYKIFDEIKERLNEIMTDMYGNYFCPKLFSFLDSKRKIEFLEQVINKILLFTF